MNYSENAVTAKVHALFAKRLTDEDYANLLSLHSNEEIFNYLRNETSYAEYLDALPSVTLSSSRFENALQKCLLDRKASLCRFQKLIGDKTYSYFIKKDEIETILYCARHLDTEIVTDLFERPSFFTREQSVSGTELQRATSFDEFADLLSQTPYGKQVEPLFSSDNTYKNLASLERVLYNGLYLGLKTAICKKFKGKSSKEVINYIEFLSDMSVISSFYRLTENYPDFKNYQAGIPSPSVTAFKSKEIGQFETAQTTKDVLNIVKSSVYGKYFTERFTNIDLFVRKLIIEKSIKNIRYSQNPILALFSYETVLQNEINNIIHIIEGVKYGLNPSEISDVIVKGGC